MNAHDLLLGYIKACNAKTWSPKSTVTRVLVRSVSLAAWVFLFSAPGETLGSSDFTNSVESAPSTLDFGIFWPPRNPAEPLKPGERPLLNGLVMIRTDRASGGLFILRLSMTLSRPSDEAGRRFWNSRLAFPEYDWMRYVRVWDASNQWLWPNLPYLLRVHGVERVERYGGVDPGKGVDNDFAAVLIRKYDSSGKNEAPETAKSPLVSAEWHPVDAGAVDKQTVVHKARSDEFVLQFKPGTTGLAAVWLVYADFLGVPLPSSWPKTPEYAGGILAYFEVQYESGDDKPRLLVRQVPPTRATGFSWESWAVRTRATPDSRRTSKLSD